MTTVVCRGTDSRYPADQFTDHGSLTDFAGVLVFHVQNIVFHLERKLVGVSAGQPISVGQTLNTALWERSMISRGGNWLRG